MRAVRVRDMDANRLIAGKHKSEARHTWTGLFCSYLMNADKYMACFLDLIFM